MAGKILIVEGEPVVAEGAAVAKVIIEAAVDASKYIVK
jgi:hypothetical protein